MQQSRREREYEHIRRHLCEVVLPFWLEHGPDWDNGGFNTCFDGITHERTGDYKFLWAQGRVLWLVCELYREVEAGTFRCESVPQAKLKTIADNVFQFIQEFGISDDMRTYFLLASDGHPTTPKDAGMNETDDLYASTFADCFVIMGLAAYAKAFKATNAFDVAKEVLQSTIARFHSSGFKTFPYPEPQTLTSHGSRMILAMAAFEVLDAAAALDETYVREASRFVRTVFRDLLVRFRRGDGFMYELVPSDHGDTETLHTVETNQRNNPLQPVDNKAGSLLTRYANPGHTIETLGLLCERFDIANEVGWTLQDLHDDLQLTLQQSWDTEYGGIFSFVLPGSSPQDIEAATHHSDPYRDEPLFHTIQRDWSLKLWWPHTEGMYTTLLIAQETGSSLLFDWYDRLKEFTLATFPREDGNEWTQIRDRSGTPLRRVVALPLKDPYHIPRSFLKLLRALARGASAG